MAAPVGKTEYGCFRLDAADNNGTGFMVALSFIDHDRPWGTLVPRTATTERISKGDAWADDVMGILFKAADKIFDPVRGEETIMLLAEELSLLNKKYPQFQCGTFNDLSAVQAQCVDGRRLDIYFPADGAYVMFDYSAMPASSRQINMHGRRGYIAHERKAFDFDGDEISPVPAVKPDKGPQPPRA